MTLDANRVEAMHAMIEADAALIGFLAIVATFILIFCEEREAMQKGKR
jgi:hypothetical protein